MGTPLTGSTVASTYTGLLKTSDNATITSTLKSLGDGGGNDSALQVSSTAVNTTGDFSVATSKFTANATSGNIAASGSANITGAATVGSLVTAGNISTSAGTISSFGAISQTQAAQNNSLAGNLAVGGNLNVTGATTLSGNLSVPGTLSCTGDFAVNTNKFNVTASSGNTAVAGTLGVAGDLAVATNKFNVTAASGNTSVAGTLGVTGATSLSTLGVSGAANLQSTLAVTGAATLSSTLDVTGTTTLNGNLASNGNTTIGNLGSDLLTINSNEITVPNLSTVPIDSANDKVLIQDATDSKIRLITASSVAAVKAIYSEKISNTQSVTFAGISNTYAYNANGGSQFQYAHTFKSVGNAAIISMSVPVKITSALADVYVMITDGPSTPSTSNVIGSGFAHAAYSNGIVVVNFTTKFISTSSSHTFYVWVASNSGSAVFNTFSISGGTPSWFVANSTFSLIETA